MQEVFEKIIKRLEEKIKEYDERIERRNGACYFDETDKIRKLDDTANGIEQAIEIVKQTAAEYNSGWIPCSERLPEEAFGCLVTVMDCEPSTQTDFENILPYFVGYDGHSWNDADGEEIPFEVIAWKKRPEPYQPKGE